MAVTAAPECRCGGVAPLGGKVMRTVITVLPGMLEGEVCARGLTVSRGRLGESENLLNFRGDKAIGQWEGKHREGKVGRRTHQWSTPLRYS